ncbi:MAG: hypothetical protein M0T84_18295 [Betaproteobacteria bacterium]|nr:hypothetical protein [Betaproteobacteria bacterium]
MKVVRRSPAKKRAPLILLATIAGLALASTVARASVISLECAFSPALTGPSSYSVSDDGRPMTPGYATGIHVWVDSSSGRAYWQWKNFQEYENGAWQTIAGGPISSRGGNYVHVDRDSISVQITTGSRLHIDRLNGTLEYEVFVLNPNTIDMFRCAESTLLLPAAKF